MVVLICHVGKREFILMREFEGKVGLYSCKMHPSRGIFCFQMKWEKLKTNCELVWQEEPVLSETPLQFRRGGEKLEAA